MPTWIGPVIAAISLAFAYIQYRQRIRVQTVVRDTLRRLAGEVNVVFSNAEWADLHFRKIGHLFADEATPNLAAIKGQVVDGARDAAACVRQLTLVHMNIRGIQQSLFKNDSEETIPELEADDVKAAAHRKAAYRKANGSQAGEAKGSLPTVAGPS
jgi:hypothetical protein